MSLTITFDSEARDQLKAGVDKLANAVKVTLGPKGRNVIIKSKFGPPVITKDGVTVARSIALGDTNEAMGADMVKQVASKTADVAGDGTTTATVLAQAMITAGLKNVAAGANPMDLKRGIDKGVIAVVEHLNKAAKTIGTSNEKIKNIATISSNNDHQIGELIAEAMSKVSRDGVITVEEAGGTETSIDILKGMQFDRGYISPYFITDSAKMEVVLEHPYIIIYDKTISIMQNLLPLLEKAIASRRPVLIIAEDVTHEALATLIVNKTKGSLKVCAVRAPMFADTRKEMLEDIATITGGTLITEDKGYKLETADLSFLGSCKRITIDKSSTIIVGGIGKKSEIKKRIDQVKVQMKKATNDFYKKKLEERLGKLAGGVAVIYVGAPTEIEMKEKKDRVDDALHATRAAVEEGIIAGGGVAYIRAIASLDKVATINEDEATGVAILRRALEEPLRCIVANAGQEGSIIVEKVKEGKNDYGYNATTGNYEYLLKSGVVDPKKVTRVALENAASIAGMLLTTECVIAEEPENYKDES